MPHNNQNLAADEFENGSVYPSLTERPKIIGNCRARVKRNKNNSVRFLRSYDFFEMVADCRRGHDALVKRVLSLPTFDMAHLPCGRMFFALSRDDDADMVEYFVGLSELITMAFKDAAGMYTPARMIRQIRELFLRDLGFLSDEQFIRLMSCTMTRRFLEFKYAFRHTYPVDASEVAVPLYARALFGSCYRRNYALHMGAWDAFGAALMEEAAKRRVAVPRPDTRTIGSGLEDEDKATIEVYRKILATKSRNRALQLASDQIQACM